MHLKLLLLAMINMVTIVLLSSLWEFWLEKHVSGVLGLDYDAGFEASERMRFILTSMVFAGPAMIIPGPLRQYVLMPGKVHTDDTPVQESGSGKTRTARLWVYVWDDRNAGSQLLPAAWFAYSPDRKSIHPQQHLDGYSGILQADAYGGYNALYEDIASRKRPVWRTPGEKSTTFMSGPRPKSSPKRSGASANCMPLKRRYAAVRQTKDWKCGKPGPCR